MNDHTALCIATQRSHITIMSILQRRYDVNSRDSHGATPLDIAIADPTSMAYPILASQGGYAAITKKSASTLLVEAIAADNMPRANYIYHHFSPKGKNNPKCITRTAEYIRYCKNHSPLASTLLIYRKIKPKQFSQHLDTLRLIAFNHLKHYILPIDILNTQTPSTYYRLPGPQHHHNLQVIFFNIQYRHP